MSIVHCQCYCMRAQDDQQVGEGNTLLLRDATYETSGEYICEVYVPSLPSLHTRGTVHIIVQGRRLSMHDALRTGNQLADAR